MKRKLTAVVGIVLILAMAFSAVGCARYSKYELKPEGSSVDNPAPKPGGDGQLTEEDIQAMNDGKATIVYGEPDDYGQQYVTFIDGKYYKEKVEDQEDAVAALQGIAGLIGFGKGSEFFANYGERDPNGYTYWVLQQKYGPTTVQYATIRVIVDPDGYVCGLSSSAVPNLGIANSDDGISEDEAVEIAKDYMETHYPGVSYKLYEENTRQVVAENWMDDCFYHSYAVYTSNPDSASNETFDLPYLEHVVTLEGEEIACNPAAAMTGGDTAEAYDNNAYFDNLEPDVWEGDVTMNDGSSRHIVVPIAKSSVDGQYYLADTERKIMLAEYEPFGTDYTVVPISSATNSGWETYMLMDLYNYGRAYDFYKEIGIYGSDTFGTPMLILVNWTENGEPVNNACNYGNIHGWLCCGASSAYYYEESLDVIAHEFTHGVTSTEMLGNMYLNEPGAINEAFSDIMGEICEHMAKKEDGSPETTDDEWYHGQGKEEPSRCMSNPNLFAQPGAVGDLYYIVPSPLADSFNDGGGNHFNSSLLNYVAWTLYKEGLPLEDERMLWFTTSALMTPRCDYDEVLAALKMSARINGLDPKWSELIEETYDQLGLTGDRTANAFKFTRSDCGVLNAQASLVDEDSKVSKIQAYSCDTSTGAMTPTYLWYVPDATGQIHGLIPEGTWGFAAYVSSLDGTSATIYYMMDDGSWKTGVNEIGAFKVGAGQTLDLGVLK